MRRRSLHRQETKRPPRYIRMRCFLLECETYREALEVSLDLLLGIVGGNRRG
jgi:hypothetical protein